MASIQTCWKTRKEDICASLFERKMKENKTIASIFIREKWLMWSPILFPFSCQLARACVCDILPILCRPTPFLSFILTKLWQHLHQDILKGMSSMANTKFMLGIFNCPFWHANGQIVLSNSLPGYRIYPSFASLLSRLTVWYLSTIAACIGKMVSPCESQDHRETQQAVGCGSCPCCARKPPATLPRWGDPIKDTSRVIKAQGNCAMWSASDCEVGQSQSRVSYL